MRVLRYFSIAILFLLIAGNLFAQRVPLTIEASEGPAQVILDGRLLGIANPTYRAQVAPGSYLLLVRKPGLPEFRQRITVGQSGLTVNARLGAAPPPKRHTLEVTSNISDAEVYVNNTKVGTVPIERSLSPGEYDLRIVSPRYQDYFLTVKLNRDRQVVANLQPKPARVSVVISEQILNQTLNYPESEVEFYINGGRINGLSAQVEQGRHRLRIVSGGFAFETSINARPGEVYTVEPVVNMQVR